MKTIINNSRARSFRVSVLAATLFVALTIPARAGFWCDAGCYATYAVSEIGCGLGWVGDTVDCVFNNSEGYIEAHIDKTSASYTAAARTDMGGFLDCETALANPNASSCSTDASQDLDNCKYGCSSND
jgi:hypothetical protein